MKNLIKIWNLCYSVFLFIPKSSPFLLLKLRSSRFFYKRPDGKYFQVIGHITSVVQLLNSAIVK